jgi:hypothetical protein
MKHVPLQTVLLGLPICLCVGAILILKLVFYALLELWDVLWVRHDLGPKLKYVSIFVNLATLPLLLVISVGLVVVTFFLLGFSLDIIVTAVLDIGKAVESILRFLPWMPNWKLQLALGQQEGAQGRPQVMDFGNAREFKNAFHDQWRVGVAEEEATDPHSRPIKEGSGIESSPILTDFSSFPQRDERVLLPTPQSPIIAVRSVSSSAGIVEVKKDTRNRRFARTFSADETGSNLGRQLLANEMDDRVSVGLASIRDGQENEAPGGTGKVRYVDRSMAEIKEVDVWHGMNQVPQVDEYDMVMSQYVNETQS